ncbi:MAG: heat-inducible transcriptional repressor HrcA [Actinomycetota bacterium]|nr:heat-inducible transcriptional repressor HrcA [Actinomycetota bacterium]
MSDDPASLEPRKAAILTAIVREFVDRAEPVGSKRIVESYGLDVSAATVRNDMAALEEAGYIAQPHTSAGRVPTDKGYRYFVDAIDELRPIGEAQRAALRGFLSEARDLEDLLRRTTSVLSRLTRYASLVLAPALDRSRLKLVELVGLAPQTVLVLLIADTGRVEKRLIELSTPIGALEIERTRTVLNETSAGLAMTDVPGAVSSLVDAAPPELRELIEHVSNAIGTELVRPDPDRVFVGGQAALAAEGTFEGSELQKVFELLEEQVTLGRVLTESASLDRPLVRIGEENEPIEQLKAASIVATGYGRQVPGSLGVLGPTRMDYPTVLAAVQAVAGHLQAMLRELTDGGGAGEHGGSGG